MLISTYIPLTIIFATFTLVRLVVGESETESNLPLDESTLGSAKRNCDFHSKDKPWFSSLYLDETLADPTVRYRYCEYPLLKIERKGLCDSSRHKKIYTYAEEPLCTDWYTKMVGDDTNFLIFYGMYGSRSCVWKTGTGVCLGPEASIVYASKGTICFNTAKTNKPCDTSPDGVCSSICGYSECESECFSLEASKPSGKEVRLVLSEFDDGRPREWRDIILNPPTDTAPPNNEYDNTDASGSSTSEQPDGAQQQFDADLMQASAATYSHTYAFLAALVFEMGALLFTF